MLYCVMALTRFADKVPPAVPLPLILKLLADCGVVVFLIYSVPRSGTSDDARGALAQLVPLLRRKFPAVPDVVRPVPPLLVATTPVTVVALSEVVA